MQKNSLISNTNPLLTLPMYLLFLHLLPFLYLVYLFGFFFCLLPIGELVTLCTHRLSLLEQGTIQVNDYFSHLTEKQTKS